MSSHPVPCVPLPRPEPLGELCLSVVGSCGPSPGFLPAGGEGRVRDVCAVVWTGAGPSIPRGRTSQAGCGRSRCPSRLRVCQLWRRPPGGVRGQGVPPAALSNLPRSREESQPGPLTRPPPVGSPSQQTSVDRTHQVWPLSPARWRSESSLYSAETPAVSEVQMFGVLAVP